MLGAAALGVIALAEALGVAVLDEDLGEALDIAVLGEALGVTLEVIDFVLEDVGKKISLLTGIDPGERAKNMHHIY